MTDMEEDPLAKEFQFYLDNQEQLVEQYNGRIIVIKEGAVLGDYEPDATAISVTRKSHEMGTFLVQRVSDGNEAYTQTFHSRVRE